MYYWLNVSQENKGIISTFLSVVLLASSPILYKFGLGNIYPIHAATLWFVCNTIFSIINIDLRKIIIEKKVFSKLLVISACSSSALVFLFYSLAILDPSTVAFANRSYILFIILLGIIALKERVQKIQLYFIALNIIGLFLFAYKGLDYSHYAPIIYAILSAFLFAYSNMQSKLILKVITPSFVNFYSNLLSSILLCPFFFLEDIRNLSLNSSIIYILVASFTGGGLFRNAFIL